MLFPLGAAAQFDRVDCPKSLLECPSEGCGRNPQLNKAKNRNDRPARAEEWSLHKIVSLNEKSPTSWPRDRERSELARLGEGTPVTVKGYLIAAHLTAPESANCYLKGSENQEVQLSLVEEKNRTRADAVILEVTPRLRPLGWTLAKLTALADETAYLRVSGWLLFDNVHAAAFNSVRATAWEIHPVTSIGVCMQSPPACDADKGWLPLEEFTIGLHDNPKVPGIVGANAISRILLRAPRTAVPGQPVTVQILLQDSWARPMKASRDVNLRVESQGAQVDPTTVVIPKGQDSIQTQVTLSKPGVADVRVRAMNSGSILGGWTPISGVARSDYTPVLPLKIDLSISPRTKLFAGETGKITALLVDSANVPIQAPEAIKISFPGLVGTLKPRSLTIERGDPFGEAALSVESQVHESLHPVPTPAVVQGRPLVVGDLPLDVQSRISRLHIVCERFAQRLWRSRIPVAVRLLDVDGIESPADKPRTVALRIEPADAAELERPEVTFEMGQREVATSVLPYREGKFKLAAEYLTEELKGDTRDLEFRYVWWFFMFIAVVGGGAGGFLRWSRQRHRARTRLLSHLVLGAITAAILYALVPTLGKVLFALPDLQLAGRAFAAFTWGVIGGVLGPATLATRFERLLRQEPSAPRTRGRN